MNEGILFPLIMIAVSLVGGGLFWLYIKTTEKKQYSDETDANMKTAQDFINIKNLKDHFLYINEGLTLIFIRIQPISIDLYSPAEKNALMRQLTVELSEINHAFKMMALSRPVDIVPLIQKMMEISREADDIRRELLEQEIKFLNEYTMSEDIVERQFYVSIWDKTDAFNEMELLKRGKQFAEKFSTSSVSAEVIGEKDIVRLLNYVYTPNIVTFEDTDFSPTIPLLQED